MKLNRIAALIVLAWGLTASAATITLLPSNATPVAGSTFSIDLQVTGNADEIIGFGLDYLVSNAAITLQSFTINPVFGPNFGLPDTQIAAINFPGQTDPTVTLVTFFFLANSAGPSVFSVISDLQDPNEGLFILASATGLDLSQQVTINVQGASGVPEPSTFAFVGIAGLFMLGKFAKRAL